MKVKVDTKKLYQIFRAKGIEPKQLISEGVISSNLYEILNGDIKRPQSKTIFSIAEYLKCEPEEFCTFGEDAREARHKGEAEKC